MTPSKSVFTSMLVSRSSDSSIGLAGRQRYGSPRIGLVRKLKDLHKHVRLVWTLVVLHMALVGIQARAQEVTAAITGTVIDPNGTAVVDALVTATDTQRGTSFATRSNADGIYYLQQVPVGTYQLRAESEPFSTATMPPFTLVLNQIARLDFHMVLGPLKEVVQVSEKLLYSRRKVRK